MLELWFQVFVGELEAWGDRGVGVCARTLTGCFCRHKVAHILVNKLRCMDVMVHMMI